MMIYICTKWGWRCSFRRTGIPEPYAVERATIEAPRFCNMDWNVLNKSTHSEIHESRYPNEYQVLQ